MTRRVRLAALIIGPIAGLLLLAVRCGSTRLLDNALLEPPEPERSGG